MFPSQYVLQYEPLLHAFIYVSFLGAVAGFFSGVLFMYIFGSLIARFRRVFDRLIIGRSGRSMLRRRMRAQIERDILASSAG